jgi:rod shape determining protein RodA
MIIQGTSKKKGVARIAEKISKLNIDFWLLLGITITCLFGFIVLYSASNQNAIVVEKQIFRLLLGFFVLIFIAQINPIMIKVWTPRLFIVSFLFLAAVPIFGEISLGARRWLDLGIIRFQPSELFKILLPLMLAWLATEYGLPNNLKRLGISLVVLAVPVLLIIKQPDLGTSILVLASSLAVIFLAGVSWVVLGAALGGFVVAAPILWYMLHDYQRQRILTLFNPEIDPSGSGFHIIQSKIAIGSGGFSGSGWLNGTQAHLNFIPEQKTDFIFAVMSEEFGMLGFLFLMLCYGCIIFRMAYMTYKMNDVFEKLVSGSIIMMFISYIFVNIGMVSGILPVVGVPLPLMSYGGTSLITMMVGFGLICSFYNRRNTK